MVLMAEYTLYHYDKEGRITATGTIDLDIFKTIPPMSTIIQPPRVGEYEELIFNIEEEKWEIIPNYEGVTFIDEEGNLHTITEVGVLSEEGWKIYEPKKEDVNNNAIEQRLAELEMAIADILGGVIIA